uniref:SAM domain-containing protein n=1 Tax=Ascaris lumbricoides TaxID=6252 RepID=A0A0M3IHS9_ASCLU
MRNDPKTTIAKSSTGTHETIDVTNMSSLPAKMDEVNTDTPLRGAWLERNSIRFGSLELTPLETQKVDGEKLQAIDDNFADLEGYLSPESLELIRQIHGRKTPVARVSRHEASITPSKANTQGRRSTASEFIHVTGRIEIL